ncbi:MAG: response regulator [Deltaproteobacteria bacterium]|nr:response regulator [Deltaproteobacteria bacterium]
MTLRVVIVEDSIVIQKALADLCSEDREIEIAGIADSGDSGVEKILHLRPDVVILDIGLPDMDGFDVVRHVMAKTPTPILIFTATLKPTWRRPAFDALSLGAIDVMLKPEGQELADPAWRHAFRTQLKLIARAPVIPHVFPKIRRREVSQRGLAVRPSLLVVVGSAGSPRVVSAMLAELKPIFPLPIPVLVALHLGRGMGSAFARHLSGVLGHPAVEAGGTLEVLRSGNIYVVPGRHHAEFAGSDTLRIFEDLPGARFAPSLDHLLQSVAGCYGHRAAAVILSGMGEDGAEGMLAVRKANGRTLGQDEATSLVYGMPQVAAKIGALEAQDSPVGLGQTLLAWLKGPGTALRAP